MLSSGRHTFNGPNACGNRKTSAVGAQPRSWYARTPYWGAREAPGICDFGPASLLRLYRIAHSEIDGGLRDDRGPFTLGRVIDLTLAGAGQLGFSDLAPVDLRVLSIPVKTTLPKWLAN